MYCGQSGYFLNKPRKIYIKQSNYRPGQALRVPGVWGSQISRQSAHGGGKFVSLTHRPPLSPGNIPGTHSVRGWVDPRPIVRLEGLCQLRFPMTPSGIEPSTFWLVAQCLNQLRHRVPHTYIYIYIFHSQCLLVRAFLSYEILCNFNQWRLQMSSMKHLPTNGEMNHFIAWPITNVEKTFFFRNVTSGIRNAHTMEDTRSQQQ
jgi:hypothetical protein